MLYVLSLWPYNYPKTRASVAFDQITFMNDKHNKVFLYGYLTLLPNAKSKKAKLIQLRK